MFILLDAFKAGGGALVVDLKLRLRVFTIARRTLCAKVRFRERHRILYADVLKKGPLIL